MKEIKLLILFEKYNFSLKNCKIEGDNNLAQESQPTVNINYLLIQNNFSF